MNVAIAGGHGKIGLRLGELLAARGDAVRGLIRDPGQEADLEAIGVQPVVCDLEADDDVATAIRGSDAVVFAAGAGPGSGAERKRTMDLGGALKLIEAARAERIRRYVIVSAMGAADPPAEGGDVYGEYLRAKAEADRALEASGLDYTVVRPGSLTDGPPRASIRVGVDLGRGEVSRADVAATLAAVLAAENAIGKSFELLAGETPIDEAVAAL
jgi:nucleoside-diphosphate-sugar epimerase